MPRLLPPVLPAGALREHRQPVLRIDDELTLRPWEPADAAVIVDAYEDPSIRFWHHRSMTLDEAEDWIRRCAEQWTKEADAEWAGEDAGGIVGRAALRGIDLTIGQAEVSYWTLPPARGQRVARRAVERAATWALDEIGFWRLEIRHSTRNRASCRVAAAAGFVTEAELVRSHIHADGWHDVHVHTRFPAGEAPPGNA